ncbi:MAG: methyltransferase domain-containing protein [Salegentibacter sp.]
MIEKIDTSSRSGKKEIMDDFELQGAELKKTLRDLENINSWLGGNRVTMGGIRKLLKDHPKEKTVHIADIGCGNGAMLRKVATWGRAAGYNLQLTGIDANEHAISFARKSSSTYPEIGFESTNIFSPEFKNAKFDIILCTLTLHHFATEEISGLMEDFYSRARMGVVINDLHRSKAAYYLFQAFCSVFIRNEIARKDGLVSILRSFKKEDLQGLASTIPAHQQEITWKWAFRYRWIIQKNHSL